MNEIMFKKCFVQQLAYYRSSKLGSLAASLCISSRGNHLSVTLTQSSVMLPVYFFFQPINPLSSVAATHHFLFSEIPT